MQRVMGFNGLALLFAVTFLRCAQGIYICQRMTCMSLSLRGLIWIQNGVTVWKEGSYSVNGVYLAVTCRLRE